MLPVGAVIALVLLPLVLHIGAVASVARWRPHVAVGSAAAALVVTGRLAQIATDTSAIIALGALAVLAGASCVALFYGSRPLGLTAVPGSLALALTIDLVRYAALGTADISDLAPGTALWVGGLESAMFVGAGLLALRGPREWTSTRSGGLVAIATIPLVLIVAELVGRNAPQLSVVTGLGLDSARGLGTTAVALAVLSSGLAAATLVPASWSRWAGVVCLLTGAILLQARAPAALLGGALLAAGLLLCARVLDALPMRPARSPTAVAVALGAGWVAFIAVEATYYALYIYTPVLWTAVAAIGAVVLVSRLNASSAVRPLRLAAAAAVTAALLLGMTAAQAAQRPVPDTLRLMTYNIHFGFDARHRPALEAIARTIEAEAPDIVLLQEAMRGSALSVQHDSLGWLAQRLGMRYVFAPTVGDIFGNAVLTRVPLEEVRRISFVRPAPLRHSPRGAVAVRVGGILIVNTHLDEFVDATRIREDQIRVLLDTFARAGPLVIGGDLNAVPGSTALELLRNAGLRDLLPPDEAREITHNAGRIDHLFGIGVTSVRGWVVGSPASDHRPVVVDIETVHAQRK